MARFKDIESGCKEYIDILNSPPNGWGQHIGPDGQSHDTLRKLNQQFGEGPVKVTLDKLFGLTNRPPAMLNGHEVVMTMAHKNCWTVCVKRGHEDYVVATWWPALGSEWMWGHYHVGEGAWDQARETFNDVTKRNADR